MPFKPAGDLSTGDKIMYDAGRGSVERVIEVMTDEGGEAVRIQLSPLNGKRPELVLRKERVVEVP